MKKSSGIFITTVLLLVFCALLTGCGRELTHFEAATQYYADGMYEEAEPEFVAASAEAPEDKLIRLGHAFNLYHLGKTNDVLAIMVPIYDELSVSGSDPEMLKEVFTVIFDIYFDNGLYSYAADMCGEMSARATDPDEARGYLLRDAMLRARRYKGSEEMFPAWIVAIEDVIDLKTYAMDEYYELYTAYRARNKRTEQLELVDRMIPYLIGHSAYADSFDRMIDILFDAAIVASYTSFDHDMEYYFDQAENFIEMSAERNMPDEALLKYKIILAERRRNFDTAYKLLGVYLSRYPDDRAAIKEMDYIRVRIGLSE